MQRSLVLLFLFVNACDSTSSHDPGTDVGPNTGTDSGIVVPDAGVGDCGDSWVLSYEVGGTFHIEETPLGAGDTEKPLTPGLLRLRFSGDENGPQPGPIQLLELHFAENFEVTSFGIRTTTRNTVRVGPNPCGAGEGQFDGNTIVWDSCTPGEGFGEDRNSWTPESGASGPGCAQGMQTAGNVHCEGVMCSSGGLEEGDNPQNDRYDQKLNNFVFSADLSTVEMEKVEIPNREPSRTFISLAGSQVEATAAPIPACLCP